jgi:hypothetical protein
MLHNEEQQRVRTTLVNYVEERTHMRLRHQRLLLRGFCERADSFS